MRAPTDGKGLRSLGGTDSPRALGLAAAAILLCAVLIPLLAFQSSNTARAASTTLRLAGARHASTRAAAPATVRPIDTTSTTVLAPAPTQTDPTVLWPSTPIPAVAAAVKAAKANAPIPTDLQPPLSQLTGNTYDTPADCQPAFGPGVTPPKLCRFGDTSSKNVVVMIGDSHSGMWDPVMFADAKAEHFAVVTVAKSGCQLSVYDINHPGWPCGSWYKWALAEDKKLHPVATIVSFLVKDGWETQPADYVGKLKTILSQVTHGVYQADFPYQDQQPEACVTASGATQGSCTAPVPSTFAPFMKAVQKMAAANHFPVMPTFQWFCADGTCPLIVNNTMVVHDKDHLTEDYVNELTNVYALELNPILANLGVKISGTASTGTTTTGTTTTPTSTTKSTTATTATTGTKTS